MHTSDITPRKAIVAGATGLVGRRLVEQLTANEAYSQVTILARQPVTLKHPKVQVKLVDYDQLEREAELFHVDDVFCCLGTTMKKAGTKEAFRTVDFQYPLALANLAKAQGAKQFLAISALGADPQSTFFYSRVKGELELALEEVGLPKVVVFRPSLLLGKRDELRWGEQAAAAVFPLVSWLLVGPLRRYRAIEASTVAEAMVHYALSSASAPFTIVDSAQMAEVRR